jgi:hypothetical protein
MTTVVIASYGESLAIIALLHLESDLIFSIVSQLALLIPKYPALPIEEVII